MDLCILHLVLTREVGKARADYDNIPRLNINWALIYNELFSARGMMLLCKCYERVARNEFVVLVIYL